MGAFQEEICWDILGQDPDRRLGLTGRMMNERLRAYSYLYPWRITMYPNSGRMQSGTQKVPRIWLRAAIPRSS